MHSLQTFHRIQPLCSLQEAFHSPTAIFLTSNGLIINKYHLRLFNDIIYILDDNFNVLHSFFLFNKRNPTVQRKSILLLIRRITIIDMESLLWGCWWYGIVVVMFHPAI